MSKATAASQFLETHGHERQLPPVALGNVAPSTVSSAPTIGPTVALTVAPTAAPTATTAAITAIALSTAAPPLAAAAPVVDPKVQLAKVANVETKKDVRQKAERDEKETEQGEEKDREDGDDESRGEEQSKDEAKAKPQKARVCESQWCCEHPLPGIALHYIFLQATMCLSDFVSWQVTHLSSWSMATGGVS